ncbi:MAG: AzlC family ABC transporter permease [Treponema sp.]|jgi:4-azaleucine resistance transporter AzlC|nr:AzlC family ABC transporter permease [Treponema sp.]
MKRRLFNPGVFRSALKYSIPVLLGYTAIGVAFGLLLSDAGYPWWIALVMSLWMYAGAGQFIASGLFAAGTTLWEACLVQFIVNARHMAYGLTMNSRYRHAGPLKPYLIFSLTDETFALLSSVPEELAPGETRAERDLFMFYVSALDQFYWTAGSVAGAAAGALIPFNMEGISFALTALFVVLMIEQILRVKKPGIFIVSAVAALLGVFLLPERVSLLSSMALSLVLAVLMERKRAGS